MAKYYNERVKESIAKYQKSHVQQVKFNFSREYDADILTKLDTVGNKQGYIKELIRADIARANSGKKEEEKTMKTWYIIDDATRAKSVVYDKDTHTSDKMKALTMAMADWNYLTRTEQDARDDFYIALTNADDDGLMDWNEITETVSLKAKYHVQREFFSLWGEDVDEKTVVTMPEVIDLARDWGKPLDELLGQLEEI